MKKAFMVITSEKIRYLVSEKTKQDIFDAVIEGEKYIFIQGDMVPLNITPTVISLERFYQQECERLRPKEQKLCQRCLKVCNILDGCPCKEIKQEDDALILKQLPPSLRKLIEKKLQNFPALQAKNP